MKTKTDCSVVVLSFNTRKITAECLGRLESARKVAESKGISVEIIVVDNNSSDGSKEMILKYYPQVKLIASKTNIGFTGGNNLGMEKSSGDYILLLNSDAFVKKDTIVNCLSYLRTNDQCALLGCKLLNKDGSLQPSAGYLPTPVNTLSWLLGLNIVDKLPIIWRIVPSVHPKNKNFFKKDHKVGWVMGAFMFMRREVYKKTKGFDEKIFMYMEEVEWCKRILEAGFGIWYVPNFSITHLGGASSSYDLKKPLLAEMQTLPYYFSKHYPSWRILISKLIKVGMLVRWVVFSLLGKKHKANIYKEIFLVV